MKKSIKVLNGSLLISLLFLASCGQTPYSKMSDSETTSSNDKLVESDYDKILAPQNLTFDLDSRKLSWDAVAGARAYDINCNGQVIKANNTATSYTIPERYLNEDEDEMLISVRAISQDNKMKSNYTTFLYNKNSAATTNLYTYEIDEETKEVAVNGINPLISDMDIQAIKVFHLGGEFNGQPVTRVKAHSFDKNAKKLNKLVSFGIEIDSSIQVIEEGAFYNNLKLTSLTFEEGIKEIETEAFYNTKLASVEFPNSLEILHDKAFSTSLTLNTVTFQPESNLTTIGERVFERARFNALYIPSKVTEIKAGAFLSNTRLDTVTFADDLSLTALPNECFQDCTKISSLTLPSSIETIGDKCFYNCSALTNLYYETDTALKEIGNEAFATSSASVLAYFGEVGGKPDVGNKAEDIANNSMITFPDSLEYIGNASFKNRASKTVTLKETSKLYHIGDEAFALPNNISGNAKNAALTTLNLATSVKEIGKSAFANNANLETINNLDKVTFDVLYNDSFTKCAFLDNYNANNRIIIGKALYSLPQSEINNTELSFDSGILTISGNLLKGKTKLTKITLSEGIANINDSAFSGCTALTTANIPNSVVNIGPSAFNNCTNLESLSFGNVASALLTEIGDSAFNNDYKIASVTLPNSVQIIGDNAFSIGSAYVNRTTLTTFTVSSSSHLEEIGENAFENQSKLTAFNIPNSVTTIKQFAFRYCSDLENLTINKETSNIEVIGESAFESSGINAINLPSSLNLIGANAFKNCANLASVDISNDSFADSLDNTLYGGTFEGCIALESITLPNNILVIEDYAFKDATSLKTITSDAEEIGNFAFQNTAFENDDEDGLITFNDIVLRYAGTSTNLKLPDDIIGINSGAFSNTNLVSIDIPDTLTVIDEAAFADCDNLQTVRIADGSTLETISAEAFKNCINLRSFNFPNSLVTIGEGAFERCINLESIDLSATAITKIDNYTFANCNSLRNIKLNDTIEEIGDYAFTQTSLSRINIPASVTSIGSHAYYNIGTADNKFVSPEYWNITPTLSNINFETNSNILFVGDYAFANNIITSLDLPNNEGLVFDEYCFANSRNLEVFRIDVGTTVHEGIISGSNKVTEIEIPGNISLALLFGGQITSIPTTLKTVTISEGSTMIAANAFSGLGMVTKFNLPTSVTEIGDYAFYGCRSITSIDLTYISKIGKNAFNGCVNLENIIYGARLEYIGDKALFATKYLNDKEEEFVIIDDILVRYNGNASKVSIPSNVTTIAGGAFSGNHEIEEVVLATSTVMICNGAFDSCSKLSRIELAHDGLVEIELEVFDTLSANLKIYVSSKNLDAYKGDLYWSLYEDYLFTK